MITKASKHPKGLYLLVFTEAWERFGFYTMQTVIILYMTQALNFSDNKANLLYASFSALLYLTPAIGGYIADKYLGFQRTIIIGGILLACGYALTALPSQEAFFLGLSILICGNGLFKPNVSSLVGELYEEDDPRRDGGFTLFYMGINLGSLIPPLITGATVYYFGWHMGFALAVVGMLICLVTLIFGRHRLGHHGLTPVFSPLLKSHGDRAKFYLLFSIGILVIIGLSHLAFHFPTKADWLVNVAGVILAFIVLYFAWQEPPRARKKMIASLILIIISIGFWALYNQTFTSLTLFADRNMQQHLYKLPLDAEAMQFFNPMFIIILSPIFSKLWIVLGKRYTRISYPLKFAAGVLMMSLGFFLLAFASHLPTDNGLTSPWWLIMSYFLQTIGELLLSPIGLAMITVLSPKRHVGMMMGVWFFAQAVSFALSGNIANLAAIPSHMSSAQSLPIYGEAFLIFGSLSMILAITSFLLIPFLNKMIHGDELTNRMIR